MEELIILIMREYDPNEATAKQSGSKSDQLLAKAKKIKFAFPLNLSGYSVVTDTSSDNSAAEVTRAITDEKGNTIEYSEPIVGEGNLNISFQMQQQYLNVVGTGIAIPVPFAIVDTILQGATNLENPYLVFDYISSTVVRLQHRIVSYSFSKSNNDNMAYFNLTLQKTKLDGLNNADVKKYFDKKFKKATEIKTPQG